MPLPSNIRAERMDGHAESDWSITGEVGGQRIELARVPYKGPDYDHAALAVCMAAGPAMLAALTDTQWSVITKALARYSSGDQPSDLVALGIIGAGVLVLDELRRAALQSATTIPTTDEGGR